MFTLNVSYNSSNINKIKKKTTQQYLLSTYSLPDTLLSPLCELPHLILTVLSGLIFLSHIKKLRLKGTDQFAQSHTSSKWQRQDSQPHPYNTVRRCFP